MKRKVFAFVLLFALFQQCGVKRNKYLKVMLGCEHEEALSDLEYHSSRLKEKLEAKGIGLEYVQDSSQCGTWLIDGEREKFLEGVWTDIDLALEVNNYYGIDILAQ